MFKYFLKLAGIFLVVGILSYLCGAFYSADFNPATWAKDTKEMVIGVPISVTVLIVILVINGVVSP